MITGYLAKYMCNITIVVQSAGKYNSYISTVYGKEAENRRIILKNSQVNELHKSVNELHIGKSMKLTVYIIRVF